MPESIPTALVIPCLLTLLTAIGVLWRDSREWQKRWAREVKRTPYDSDFPEEPTGIRNQRDLILKEYLKGNGNK